MFNPGITDTSQTQTSMSTGLEDSQTGYLVLDNLSKEHKREIVNWAVGASQALREEHLRCLDALLRTIEPVLRAAQ